MKPSTRRWRCLPHRMVQEIVRAVKRQPIAPISDRPKQAQRFFARSMRSPYPPVVCFAPTAVLGSWWTGSIFQQRQFPVVTVVVADGRVYTVEEFAKTMVNVQAA